MIEATSKIGLLAELLPARAEVAQIAEAPAKAAADLRRALQIYQQKGATHLADRVSKFIAELAPAAARQY